jgi:hypothetical protein
MSHVQTIYPDNCFIFRVYSFVGSIVLKITYGYTTKEQDDPFILRAERVMQELFLAGSPDQMPWLVDFFPIRERLIPNPNIWILKFTSVSGKTAKLVSWHTFQEVSQTMVRLFPRIHKCTLPTSQRGDGK